MVDRLRAALVGVLDQQDDDGGSRLAQGLHPYPEGWRAHTPYLAQTTRLLADPIRALPRYPMVLHRGGWPDGS